MQQAPGNIGEVVGLAIKQYDEKETQDVEPPQHRKGNSSRRGAAERNTRRIRS